MVKFEINQLNYKNLPRLARVWQRKGAQNLGIEVASGLNELPSFSKIIPFLCQLLDKEQFFEIWLKNMPFCILADDARDHILNDENFKGEKLPKCKKCFYFKKCAGFPEGYFKKYGQAEIKPIKDLPCEVMIEVEPRCNFNCQFCFNKISFAKTGRDIKSFSTDYIKKIIDSIVRAQIKIVRFTGGEPLLRKDIFGLMKYAKNKGLEVRLNTNGSLITPQIAKDLKGIVDNVLLPIESYQPEKEGLITGKIDSLNQKIKAIKLLKKAKIPIVRVGTVALRENILKLEKFAEFIFKLPVDEWELYRPISGEKMEGAITNKDVAILVDKLIKIKKKTGRPVFIANALPFCSVNDLNKINSVSQGALFDDGHCRLVIDPRGFVKPHYFLDKNLGGPVEILAAWNHPFVKKMRNLEFAPEDCRDCAYLQKCRGGSRFLAKLYYGRWDAKDPLMPSKNVLNNN